MFKYCKGPTGMSFFFFSTLYVDVINTGVQSANLNVNRKPLLGFLVYPYSTIANCCHENAGVL